MRPMVWALVVATLVQVNPSMTREQAVLRAKQALAQQIGVPADRIKEREANPMEWPDGGIGCPEKGRLYPQVLTEGYRVLLAVNQQIYRVHVAGVRAVVCGEPLSLSGQPQPASGEPLGPKDVPIADPADAAARKLVAAAMADLAKRLSLTADAIALLEYKDVIWPDRGLGCPQPGIEYPQVTVDGVRIRLMAKGRAYDYHAGGGRDPFLCENPRKR